MPQSQHKDILITTKQIREAIWHSGYLLEQKVEPILRKEFGYVQTNDIYFDVETNKSCEIDIHALSASRIYDNDFSFVFPMLLCECENNSQPIVFFTNDSVIPFFGKDDLKISGLPIKFWNNKIKEYMGFADFVGFEKFHHYCSGMVSTQYCTFQMTKDKSKWLALHNDEQHNTFNKLIKAVNYEINKHFEGWSRLENVTEEPINIQIYYPLVILQGELYSAYLKNNRFILNRSNHIQFRKQFISSSVNEPESYQIDVIVESYLPYYLKILEVEVDKITKILQQKKSTVLLSIEKIVEEGKALKDKSKSYREILELK